MDLPVSGAIAAKLCAADPTRPIQIFLLSRIGCQGSMSATSISISRTARLICGTRFPADMAAKPGGRHRHGDRPDRPAGPVVDGDPEGRDAFLGLLHVERETRPSRACQFAAKRGELFRCQALIRRLAVLAGFVGRPADTAARASRRATRPAECAPPDVRSAGSTCPWRSPTRSIAVDSADDRKRTWVPTRITRLTVSPVSAASASMCGRQRSVNSRVHPRCAGPAPIAGPGW